MNILVYGAGVLGSYLAHALKRGGNDVTVLARGKRAEELERNGVVVRHYFQLRTTLDRVRVIRTLEINDQYDLIFVVMKYSDFPSVLPILAVNQSSHIVIVGNNADARQMQSYLEENSRTKKHVAFGFQLSGGRRYEDGRILAVRGGGQMVLGGLDGPIPFQPLLDKAFKKASYKLDYHDDIDAWLKSHIIAILVLNTVSFSPEGGMKKLDGDKRLLLEMIEAMDEGFRVLEAMDITITPAGQVKFIRERKRLVYYFLKLYSIIPIYKLIDGTIIEMEALSRMFAEWKRETNTSTPSLDRLVNQFSPHP
jgi:2-dehydropantoate 2-reductase